MAVAYSIYRQETSVYLTVTGESSYGEWVGALRRVLPDPAYTKGFDFLTGGGRARRRGRTSP